MKKFTIAPAIIAISMMLSPINANASIFWLDIVKAAAKGLVTIVADNQKGSPGNKIPSAGTAPAVQPTEQELTAAFDSLARHCKDFSRQGLPCGMHSARSTISLGNALEIANTRADGELSKAMGQFVKTSSRDILKQVEDEEGSSEIAGFERTLEILSEQELRGAQTYITYSRVKKNDKGKDVYEVWVVRVMDANLFERALAESSKGSSIGGIIGEFVKGFAAKVKASVKKKN